MKILTIILFIFSLTVKSQVPSSSFEKGIAIGSILIQGFQALKGSGSKNIDPNSKTVESVCFKNKTEEKITVKFNGTIGDESINKELVVQKNEKECTFNLPKGIYTYEIILANKDVFQKGEYKVSEESLVVIDK